MGHLYRLLARPRQPMGRGRRCKGIALSLCEAGVEAAAKYLAAGPDSGEWFNLNVKSGMTYTCALFP